MFTTEKKNLSLRSGFHWETTGKTANPRSITCQRNEPYVLVHLKPGYWINTPHPNLACMSIPHRRLIWPLNPDRLFALASLVSAQTAYKTGCHPSVHGTQLKPCFRQHAWEKISKEPHGEKVTGDNW